MEEGPIRTVNTRIRDFIDKRFSLIDEDLSLALAKRKFKAKFECPKRDSEASRRKDAWTRWISFDEELQTKEVLGPYWAKARLLVHQYLRDFRLGELVFTNGSSFEPLGNRVSVACKLTGTWTITADCFGLFAKYSYFHRGLKMAAKKRFTRYCTQHGWDEKAVNRKLWKKYKHRKDAYFQIYCFKLFCSLTFVGGNRWSTVPKNNSKDRSICLEPLCNMLVQRALGLGLRRCLIDNVGIDLDFLADVHRSRISDKNVATIDLSDCSDAISVRLITYLLPRRVLERVLACRSDMTLGPDGNYYVVRKVSSMGNGFTFDLMTIVLTALTRSFDATSSVFGDDIICQNSIAKDVVDNLRVAGFVVNEDKTFINSQYRESCGSHYIDGRGYVPVFDVKWATCSHDIVVICNKIAILSAFYGEPFESLREEIWTCIPSPWLGSTTVRHVVCTGRPLSFELDNYIRYGPVINVDPPKKVLKRLRRKLRDICKYGRISTAVAFDARSLPAPSSLRAEDWDMYLMYIRNSRLTRKISRKVIKSTLVARVDEEQIGFISALLH